MFCIQFVVKAVGSGTEDMFLRWKAKGRQYLVLLYFYWWKERLTDLSQRCPSAHFLAVSDLQHTTALSITCCRTSLLAASSW